MSPLNGLVVGRCQLMNDGPFLDDVDVQTSRIKRLATEGDGGSLSFSNHQMVVLTEGLSSGQLALLKQTVNLQPPPHRRCPTLLLHYCGFSMIFFS